MEDLLIETLEAFGYPVRLQGSLLPDEPYPDDFFTFWNNDSYGNSYYNNIEASTVFSYDVNFYSVSPDRVYSKLREAAAALKAAGFIVSGDGYSVGSDEPSHDGRGINVLYRRENNVYTN
jgi:cephalosporin-C deacetylase-like acetyl esterase